MVKEENFRRGDDLENCVDKDRFAFANAHLTDLSERIVPVLLHGLAVVQIFEPVHLHGAEVVEDLCEGDLRLLADEASTFEDLICEDHLD